MRLFKDTLRVLVDHASAFYKWMSQSSTKDGLNQGIVFDEPAPPAIIKWKLEQ